MKGFLANPNGTKEVNINRAALDFFVSINDISVKPSQKTVTDELFNNEGFLLRCLKSTLTGPLQQELIELEKVDGFIPEYSDYEPDVQEKILGTATGLYIQEHKYELEDLAKERLKEIMLKKGGVSVSKPPFANDDFETNVVKRIIEQDDLLIQ